MKMTSQNLAIPQYLKRHGSYIRHSLPLLTAASSFIFPYFLTPTLPDLLSLHLLCDFFNVNWQTEILKWANCDLSFSFHLIPSAKSAKSDFLPEAEKLCFCCCRCCLMITFFFPLMCVIFFFILPDFFFPVENSVFFPGSFLTQYSLVIITYLFKTLLSQLFPDDFSDCYNFFF